MTIDVKKLIGALRETARLATETKDVAQPQFDSMGYHREPPIMQVEVHSKEWIAGRLEGMADTLEALNPEET